MIVSRALLAGLFVLTFGASASAQWSYARGQDDPFAGGRLHLALVAAPELPGVLFGARCVPGQLASLLFVTNERARDELEPILTSATHQLLLVLDDAPKIEIEAEADVTPDGRNLRLVASEITPDQLVKVASARRRVAVAWEMNGKVLLSRSFSASNARRAMDQMMTACKISRPVN